MNKHSDLVWEYRHIEEVTSTNDMLRDFAPEADITVLSTSFQTKGRGQMGNTWVSDAGENALFSILVCPEGLKAADGFILSQAMALSVKDALDSYLDEVVIKWPNDIYCHGEKICGSLIENTLMGKSVGRSIIGTGININQTVFPEGLAAPPTSLRRHIDREVSPASLVRSVAEAFSRYYAEIKEGCYDNIRELYHRHLYLRGRVARFRDEAGIFSGTISHVEPDGHLIVIDDSSVSRRYAFKQVQLIRDDRIL